MNTVTTSTLTLQPPAIEEAIWQYLQRQHPHLFTPPYHKQLSVKLTFETPADAFLLTPKDDFMLLGASSLSAVANIRYEPKTAAPELHSTPQSRAGAVLSANYAELEARIAAFYGLFPAEEPLSPQPPNSSATSKGILSSDTPDKEEATPLSVVRETARNLGSYNEYLWWARQIYDCAQGAAPQEGELMRACRVVINLLDELAEEVHKEELNKLSTPKNAGAAKPREPLPRRPGDQGVSEEFLLIQYWLWKGACIREGQGNPYPANSDAYLVSSAGWLQRDLARALAGSKDTYKLTDLPARSPEECRVFDKYHNLSELYSND